MRKEFVMDEKSMLRDVWQTDADDNEDDDFWVVDFMMMTMMVMMAVMRVVAMVMTSSIIFLFDIWIDFEWK